ncbi:alanine--tRNA ligase-related protein [Streptomyces sp. NPDC057555]|uniref:Alanyl-tRNA synthetase n=1 Tax=Streptomyces sp. JCM 9888 TaxID=1570103 RepID=A0A0B5H302_9ACTN|nr:Alanyl-tRNA synthetase [Streptomyces sp. JCM 9888]
MIFDQSEIDRTGPRFLASLRERGYTETPSAPLTAADRSVTFVNASITPFKPRLLAGDAIGRTCQVQQCLRATGRAPWLYVFGMLGVLADGTYLEDVIDHAPQALLAAAPWLAAERLAIAVDRDHDDLRAYLEKSTLLKEAPVREVRHEEVPTRWSYGKDGRLTGRGITFFHREDVADCGPECAIGCRCGRWRELGQVIEVSSPNARYAEAGFGLEPLQSIALGGNPYALPAVRALTDRLREVGVPEDAAPQAANLLRAVTALVEEDVQPGGKGGANVMRRFLRELLGLLGAADSPDDEWRERVHRAVRDERVADALLAEGERWRTAHVAARAAARAHLRRRPETPAHVLAETFGVPMEQARQMCLEATRP